MKPQLVVTVIATHELELKRSATDSREPEIEEFPHLCRVLEACIARLRLQQ